MGHIAFLGAGNMGRGMIQNLLRCGHNIAVYNRTRAKVVDLEANGARFCATPGAAAAGASIIIAMVTDDAASRACWTGVDGVLSVPLEPGVQAIECSSISRDWLLELGRLAAGRMALMDCPVAGRPDAAAAGQLKVFAGGRSADIARVTPYLRCFSTTVTYFGPLGSGLAFKLLYNMVGASQIAAIAEALNACDALGIDLSAAATALSEGNTGSAHVKRHAAWMADNSHPRPAEFSGAGRIKDLSYVSDLLAGTPVECRIAQAALADFTVMRDFDMALANDSEVFEALRQLRTAPS